MEVGDDKEMFFAVFVWSCFFYCFFCFLVVCVFFCVILFSSFVPCFVFLCLFVVFLCLSFVEGFYWDAKTAEMVDGC